MKVESYDGKERGIRIGVTLGGVEHWMPVTEATALRDALIRELGAPQALCRGEEAVWAAAYMLERQKGYDAVVASRYAAVEVCLLRGAAGNTTTAGDARSMLIAMTGGGR